MERRHQKPIRPPMADAREVARIATREALRGFGYRFPDEVWQRVGLETRWVDAGYAFELRIAGGRPIDSILLTRCLVGPTLDDVRVEVFHDTLRDLGVPRDEPRGEPRREPD